MEPQPVDLGVVGLEVVAGQPLEALVGCAEDVHVAGSLCLHCRAPMAPTGHRAATVQAAHDPADEAMCARARERYAADRKRGFGRAPQAPTPRCRT